MPKQQAAISIDNLSVMLGGRTEALHNISTTISGGRITGLIGPSGAGKTTLIRALVGRQQITSGSIKIFGLSAGSAELRHQIAYMTQELSVYSDLTVLENLHYFAVMLGITRKSRKQVIEGIIETLDMRDKCNTLVQQLSGGQKQRVSLAITLIGKPKLLVLDEPTVGLDPVLREQIWKLMHNLTDAGATIIISSHVMDEAERCDELLLLRNGRLLASGSPDELCKRTGTNSVEQSFLKLVGSK